MATLLNEITINAPLEKIWTALSDIERLERYDPTVVRSIALSQNKSGLGAKRRVSMMDGKNWFEEQCTVWNPNIELTYALTACSFPVQALSHTYTFKTQHREVKVKQVMQYTVKYGWFGKLLDTFMIRRQSDCGIKKFLAGLKSYTENN